MDELPVFLFGAALVIVIVIAILKGILIGVATLSINLYTLLDHVLSGLAVVPPPISWGLAGGLTVALIHFAMVECPEFERPALARGIGLLVVGMLVLSGIAVQNLSPARVPWTPDPYKPPPKVLEPGPSPTLPPTYPPPPTIEGKRATAYVNTILLNVRRGPGTDYDVFERIPQGTPVIVTDRRTNDQGAIWARIEWSGNSGWVNSTKLSDSPVPEIQPSGASAARDPLPCGTYFWDAGQLTSRFADHTWEGATSKVKWREYYAPDGTVYGRAWRDGKQRPDWTGRWRIDGSSFCVCSGDCQSYACRKVKQIGVCPGSGETWTWDLTKGSKWREVSNIRQGDVYNLR